MVYGGDEGEMIAGHVQMASSRAGVVDIYRMALADQDNQSSGVLRARQAGRLVGSLVIYSRGSRLLAWRGGNNNAGGISSPVISPLVGGYSSVVERLITLGVRQLERQYGVARVVVDCVGG